MSENNIVTLPTCDVLLLHFRKLSLMVHVGVHSFILLSVICSWIYIAIQFVVGTSAVRRTTFPGKLHWHKKTVTCFFVIVAQWTVIVLAKSRYCSIINYTFCTVDLGIVMYWIFQGNPYVLNIFRCLRSIDKMFSCEMHFFTRECMDRVMDGIERLLPYSWTVSTETF